MIDKKVINGILALLSVLVLLVPIGVADYVQETRIENILNIQSQYTEGITYTTADGNTSELMGDFWGTSTVYPIGFDANNDTAFIGYAGTSVPMDERYQTYFGNYNTYTGSGNNTMVIDYTDVPEASYTRRYLVIPINATNEEIATQDFFRLHTDLEYTGGTQGLQIRIGYQPGTQWEYLEPTYLDSDTLLFPIDVDDKSAMNLNPNATVFIYMWFDATEIDETQTSWQWKLESVEISPTDYAFGYEFSDFTVWVLLVFGLDVFYGFVLIMSNPVIDFKWDNKKLKAEKK